MIHTKGERRIADIFINAVAQCNLTKKRIPSYWFHCTLLARLNIDY